ncbi:hypothetical protein P3T18_007250 [Paraburkholderia sp. GAS199]|uniref:TagK domain-containing protein n=1 Tax=Paraburkholderia sp. GAS199 TaxID=3035126 RepID=UPI003D1F00A7
MHMFNGLDVHRNYHADRPTAYSGAAGEEIFCALIRNNYDDLLSDLDGQYYQALGSNYLFSRSDWIGSQNTVEHRSTSQSLEAHDGTKDGSHSIHHLLSDVEMVEEAFGPLHTNGFCGEMERVPAEEILSLFAPPEYSVRAETGLAAAPSFIVRRDHHTLAIDSPLAALNSATTNAERNSDAPTTP